MWILQVLRPTAIKFGTIRVGQRQCTFAFGIAETFPQGHRKLGPVIGGQLEQVRQRTRRHDVIVARLPRRRQFGPRSCDQARAICLFVWLEVFSPVCSFSSRPVCMQIVSTSGVESTTSAQEVAIFPRNLGRRGLPRQPASDATENAANDGGEEKPEPDKNYQRRNRGKGPLDHESDH